VSFAGGSVCSEGIAVNAGILRDRSVPIESHYKLPGLFEMPWRVSNKKTPVALYRSVQALVKLVRLAAEF
jgi:hypothetical protein